MVLIVADIVTVGAVALIVVAGMIALSVWIIVIAVEMTVKVSSHSWSLFTRKWYALEFKLLQPFPDVKYLLSTSCHIIVSFQACLLTPKDGEGHLPISNTLVDPLYQTLPPTAVQRINNFKFIARQCLKLDPMPL